MPVFTQGYRKYVGEKSRGGRAFAIAWQNVRPRLRWWVWAILFLLLFWPYLMHAVTIFAATLASSVFQQAPVMAMKVKPIAFADRNSLNPALLLGMLQGNSLTLFWDLLHNAVYATFIVPAVVGAGLLASDRRTGGLQIYFARPVSRFDYLFGKILAATFFVSLTTAIPCLLIWLETVAFGSAADFTYRTWITPLVILGASSFYALWAVALVLSLSSLMRRPTFVAITAIVIFLMLEGVGQILARALRDTSLGKGWHMISPSYAIGAMTAPLCGLELPPWVNGPMAFGVAVVVPLALLAFVWLRLRAVEVST